MFVIKNQLSIFIFIKANVTNTFKINLHIVFYNRCDTASATLRLLLDTLGQPSPNIAHFLLGFNVHKPLSQTDLQAAGKVHICLC